MLLGHIHPCPHCYLWVNQLKKVLSQIIALCSNTPRMNFADFPHVKEQGATQGLSVKGPQHLQCSLLSRGVGTLRTPQQPPNLLGSTPQAPEGLQGGDAVPARVTSAQSDFTFPVHLPQCPAPDQTGMKGSPGCVCPSQAGLAAPVPSLEQSRTGWLVTTAAVPLSQLCLPRMAAVTSCGTWGNWGETAGAPLDTMAGL